MDGLAPLQLEDKNRIATGLDISAYGGRKYLGQPNYRMQDIVRDGRAPISYAGLMDLFLEAINTKGTPTETIDSLIRSTIDTGDGMRRHPDGSLKYAWDSATLRTLNPQSPLSHGALVLTPEEYAMGDGPEFTSRQVEKYTDDLHYSVCQVLRNPLWRHGHARGDIFRLKAFADAILAIGKERLGYDGALHIFAPGIQSRPIERLCSYSGGSGVPWAAGLYWLDERGGRILGVVPESLK